MSSIDLSHAVKILEDNKARLPLTDDGAKDQYVSRFKEITGYITDRTPEDYRKAAEIAVSASKAFVQIAIAVFVVLGGFIQYAMKSGLPFVSTPVILLSLAAALTFLSLCFGFNYISKVWKRGEGREETDDRGPWSTDAAKTPLNLQALLGVGALILFALGIIAWGIRDELNYGSISVVIPQKTGEITISVDRLTIAGTWSKLELRTLHGDRIDLGSVAQGQEREIFIKPK